MKDAKGHGSNVKGAHAGGVEQVGRRYHVKLVPYSLEAHNLGQSLGQEHVISTHRSLTAAGDKLGSMISGKLADTAKSLTGSRNGARYLVEDKMTGNHYTRNGARTGTPINRATSIWTSEKP